MKSDPLPEPVRALSIDVLHRWANKYSTFPRRVGAWILRELRGALPATIFFFVGFNFIILTTNLLVADYPSPSVISCSPPWRRSWSTRP